MGWLLSKGLAMLAGKAGPWILVSVAVGAFGGGFWLADELAGGAEARAANQRLEAQLLALAVTNAANEAVHALELADKDRAIEAVEAVAKAAQAAAERLLERVAALQARYQAQGYDPVLSPAAQGYYDQKRGGP